jgi:type I restriction-modification system DNA methylase subunit
MENSLNTIEQLVANFKANKAAYLASNYSESQVRQDFIDKFFTALGWDVTHTKQLNPYAQEVKIENRVTMPGTQRRADYAFSIAPNFDQIKFFVEAKKPSRSLANADDYFQTIRYAWNTKIPIAVLTDFEEFHILDCRYKPNIKTALERRIGEYRYTDYADKETFAKIFHLFGREAVAAGSLEKYAAGLPKKGTKQVGGIQPVDDAFLEELDGYREILAKAFKKTNEALQGDELTEAVQRTIDRLVFIRFLEDKGIEDKQIISIADPKTAWKSFVAICKRFEPKYNGLVFKSHRILDSGEFHSPDGAAIAAICQKISDPSSPYDFNFIPISILGSIYERFLGKVVHATEKRVKVEEKPEVRKAGGVYYTPEYIVQYIVRETVGKLIEGKKPEQIASMAFADIACGSGSFLIEVYAQVLEYHLQYYMNHPESVGKDVLFERDGKKYLTLKKKKEILTNNVYGVDIDFQATEVTQLSLYLKMLENATMNDAHQFALFRETILPDLRQNIICGNSLIGRDILEGDLFSTVDESKLKPMNYEDAFPKIMKRGGFDAVVGNPPYIRIQSLNDTSTESVEYYSRKYVSAKFGNYDIYVAFVERALQIVNHNGDIGYILPHKFFNAQYGEGLRGLIAKGKYLSKIVHFGDQQIFSGATTYTCLLFLSMRIKDSFSFVHVPNLVEWQDDHFKESEISSKIVSEKDWNFTAKESTGVLDRIKETSATLGMLVEKIAQGIRTSANEVYVIDSVRETELSIIAHSKILDAEISIEKRCLQKFLLGKEIKPYSILPSGKYVIVPYQRTENKVKLIDHVAFVKSAPKTFEYLLKNKDYLSKREKGRMKGANWYAYIYPKNIDVMKMPKILVPDIANRASFALDERGEFAFTSGYAIILRGNTAESLKYILGLLNSRVLDFFLKSISTTMRGGYFRYFTQYLEQLPIHKINFSDPSEISKHDRLVKMVDQMLNVKQKLTSAKTESEKNRLELLCASLDRKIDEAVYELYGLTEDEIKIVEGKN